MIKKLKMQRWIPSLIAVVALAGSASLCQAQSLITLSNDSSESPAFYDGGPAGATYTWQATGGPNGGGCLAGTIDGATTLEFDPSFNATFPSGKYLQVTLQMKVDSGSGTTGVGGSGGYGNLQGALRDAGNSWNGMWIGTIYPPAANGWVTYTFAITASSVSVTHLQFQLQAGSAYSGPVTIYIGNVTVVPIANPMIFSCFTNSDSVNWNNYGLAGVWDGSQDAPYYNPVTGAGPINVTPAGSIQFDASLPNSYSGGQLLTAFNPLQFQWVGLDVYYDGPTPSTSTDYAGMQVAIAGNGTPNYNWTTVGVVNFNASMVGKWIHYDFPLAASGVPGAQGFAFQTIPNGGGAVPITWHVDNIQLWNPTTKPVITAITRNTLPGGTQIFLDANGNSNPNDQEGICTPSATNAVADFFWVNQTPAAYSFTLTNFPAPASAFTSVAAPPASVGAGYDAHIYLCNADSLVAAGQSSGYNQTYSGANYNMVDGLELHVQNASVLTNAGLGTFTLSNGVVAIINWKTNAPNSNATNAIVFNFPTMASANGTWTLNFSDNTHGSLVAADGSVNPFTLPDFTADPNYSANFQPASSFVHIGVFKNGNTNNNTLGNVFTSVTLTNTAVAITDNFSGPGLKGNNQWQIAEYYQYAANRTAWTPAGTAWWLKWNTTQAGFSVLSTNNLSGGSIGWPNGGVTYTYTDTTGTNTIGAVPSAALPVGNAAFFEIMQP